MQHLQQWRIIRNVGDDDDDGEENILREIRLQVSQPCSGSARRIANVYDYTFSIHMSSVYSKSMLCSAPILLASSSTLPCVIRGNLGVAMTDHRV